MVVEAPAGCFDTDTDTDTDTDFDEHDSSV
jgi:hypothetical protein